MFLVKVIIYFLLPDGVQSPWCSMAKCVSTLAQESMTPGRVRVDTAANCMRISSTTSQMICPFAYSWGKISVDPKEGYNLLPVTLELTSTALSKFHTKYPNP